MNKNHDLDQLLEDFLRDDSPATTQLSKDEFNAKVLSSLPQGPKLLWVTSVYPVLGILVAAFVVWKIRIFDPRVLMKIPAKLSLYFGIDVTSVSTTVSMASLIVVAVMAIYFLYQKIEEI